MDKLDVKFNTGIERVSIEGARNKEGLPAQYSRLSPARNGVISQTANQFPDESLNRQLLNHLRPGITDSARLTPMGYAQSLSKARLRLQEEAKKAGSPAKRKRLSAGQRLLDREKENHDLLDMLRQALLRS